MAQTESPAVPLPELLTRLRRVLEHERRLGYRDRAALGGIDRFLAQWTEELAKVDSQLARRWAEVRPGGFRYAAFDLASRAAWVSEALEWVQRLMEAQPRPTPARPVGHRAPVTQSLPQARQPGRALDLEAPVSRLPGVGTTLASRLRKLGVQTVGDLLTFYPHRYDDFTRLRSVAELKVGEEQTAIVTVWSVGEVRLGGRRSTEAVVGDETGNIRVVWFNQPHMARVLKRGQRIVLSGKVGFFRGQRVWESPAYELWQEKDLLHTGRLVPVYPLTEGLHPRRLRETVKAALDAAVPLVEETLPEDVLRTLRLLPRRESIRQVHFPDNAAALAEARRRLAFEELLLLQLGVLQRRLAWQAALGRPLQAPEAVQGFLASLPFPLTKAQERALAEILADLARSVPMSRLLQGDVGSGKTVVAFAALIVASASDAQGVLMAPTEVLAEQHERNLRDLLARNGAEIAPGVWSLPYLDRPLRVRMLLGGMSRRAKELVRDEARQGLTDILIGTHALLEESTEMPRLGLAIVDEQHRFGVMQRWRLRQKGFNPHMLVMTATPIPRSLALSIYGDLDLSVLDEMPPGRQPVRTRVVEPNRRHLAEEYIRRRIAEGEQAFVVCPLVRESEALEAAAATEEWRRWREEVFPELQDRIGLLHGRMTMSEKEAVMRRFRSGELAVLVCTPVVEVGIDVPNATVMLVEAAERFGLAQLHQLRGRVGRGAKASVCILIAENPSKEARERLQILEQVHDGFRLAEEDLRLRGPGEFLGTRQSGLPPLRLASLGDIALLRAAREVAQELLRRDPELRRPEHRLLAREVERAWGDLEQRVGEFS